MTLLDSQSIKFRDPPHYEWCNWSSFNGSTKHDKRSGSRNHGNLISKRREMQIWTEQASKIYTKNAPIWTGLASKIIWTHLIKVFSRSFFLHSSVRSATKGWNTNNNDEDKMLLKMCWKVIVPNNQLGHTCRPLLYQLFHCCNPAHVLDSYRFNLTEMWMFHQKHLAHV